MGVSAINQTVFATTEDQLLAFEVNGETADLEALEEAGYTVEFLASKDVFEDSETGELKATLPAGSFDYQVVVSKEGQDDIASEFAEVTVIEGSAVASIDTYILTTSNGVELNSTTLVSNETATIDAKKGTSVDGKEIEDISVATYKSSNNNVALVNASTGVITPVQAGEVTITITSGKATKEVNLTITDEARKVTTVTANKDAIGTVTDAESTIKLTVKDQYGDLLSGKTLTAASVQNSDKKNILTVTAPDATSTKGEVTVTVTGDSENTGSGSLVFKDADKTVLSVPVTVGSSKEVAKLVLELDSSSESKDNEIDVIDADDNQLTLVYNQYAAGDLLIGPEKSNTYKVNVVQPSSGDVVTANFDDFASTGQITLTAKKAGEATVQIKEGELVRASYKVVVTDSTPSIESVTFEKDPAITALETDLSTVLNAANIKLTSTDAVEITSEGKIVLAGKEVEVGSIDFVSTVGAATIAGGQDEALIISIDNDLAEDIKGTVTLRVKDTSGKVIATKAISVEIAAEPVALAKATLAKAEATGNFGNEDNINEMLTALFGTETTTVQGIEVSPVFSVEEGVLTINKDNVTEGVLQWVTTQWGGTSLPVAVSFAGTPKDKTTDANWNNAYTVWVDLGNLSVGESTIEVEMTDGPTEVYSLKVN